MPRNIIDVTDLTVEEIDQLISTAEDILANPAKYQDACAHKQLATLFFEPSTRTRLSFESAMLALGGGVLGFSEASSSSTSKGETVGDTVHTVSCYADIIAMRHPKEGAPFAAAQFSEVPIINAGDGGHNHPTQTLTDLLTIHREKGRLDGFTIGFCGDLKFGRTVHSLVNALSRYENVKFVLISPAELKLPRYVKEQSLEAKGIPYVQTTDLESVMPELDILYMTRVQKERFADAAEYERVKDSYVLDAAKMRAAREDMIVLHPLPRVNEIAREVDNDPRAAYFRQVENGKFVRMALIYTLLQWAGGNRPFDRTPRFDGDFAVNELRCPNNRCISATEDVDQLFRRTDEGWRCAYCESRPAEETREEPQYELRKPRCEGDAEGSRNTRRPRRMTVGPS